MDNTEKQDSFDSHFKFEGKLKWVCIAILTIAFLWEIIFGDSLIWDVLWYLLTFLISPYLLKEIWNKSISEFYNIKKVNYFWALSIVCAFWVIG